jgi:hypothetical protein
MRSWFRRSRPWQLFLAWSLYWLGLALVTLMPAIEAAWRMSQQANGHGSANAGVTDGILSASIVESGRTMWDGSIHLFNLALLVGIPPLILWLLWLIGAARTNHATEIRRPSERTRSELYPGDPGIGTIETSTSTRRAREES